MGAERLINAEKGTQKIVVEVKSFVGRSDVKDLEQALGQYVLYRHVLNEMQSDKIWIQYDDTEEGVATDLLAAGVPKEDIILGFRHPQMRQYTEFGTGLSDKDEGIGAEYAVVRSA